MLVIAWFIFAFTIIQFMVALVNLLLRPGYSTLTNQNEELVSVLIPARNEENNIGNLLVNLQKQEYSNIEIIVFNDQSTDNTEKVVSSFMVNDKRIKLINSIGLPEGWLGKNHACHELAKCATGRFFLFLDADVRVEKNLLNQTIAFARKHQLALLSIFPKQVMKSWGEKITVPNMNYILLTLLPLVLVRKTRFPSLSAANGQFMLFDADIYKQFLPHEQVKFQKVEDIEIAGFYKRKKLKIACHAGNAEISCRMYNSFHEALQGFSRSVIMFFGNSFILALFFWFFTTFGFLVILFHFPFPVFMGYLILILLTRFFVSIISHQNWFLNILLIPVHQVTLAIFIYKAFVNNYRKQFEWKGRYIS